MLDLRPADDLTAVCKNTQMVVGNFTAQDHCKMLDGNSVTREFCLISIRTGRRVLQLNTRTYQTLINLVTAVRQARHTPRLPLAKFITQVQLNKHDINTVRSKKGTKVNLFVGKLIKTKCLSLPPLIVHLPYTLGSSLSAAIIAKFLI